MVVVVNHPSSAEVKTRRETEETFRFLQEASKHSLFPLIPLRFPDPGTIHGVGEARKHGMDYAVQHLLHRPTDRIVSLDADAKVSLNYCRSLAETPFSNAAFTLRFEHPFKDADDPRAIALYELYLRYNRWQLKRISSPFAFYSVGSCLGTDLLHYQTSGGMPSKSATEDFHFLNKLRKLGEIDEWPHATVYPSTRTSRRVMLGTGYFLSQYAENPEEALQHLVLPSPKAFDRLRCIQNAVHDYFQNRSGSLKILSDNPLADRFFSKYRLYEKLERLLSNSSTSNSFVRRSLQLFDGLQIYRLLRLFASEEGPPSVDQWIEWCVELAGETTRDPVHLCLALREKERVLDSNVSVGGVRSEATVSLSPVL